LAGRADAVHHDVAGKCFASGVGGDYAAVATGGATAIDKIAADL